MGLLLWQRENLSVVCFKDQEYSRQIVLPKPLHFIFFS